MPQNAAGMRTEPAPSVPTLSGPSPAATAAAVPPDDPPGVRLGSHGLRVMPVSSRVGLALAPELGRRRLADEHGAGLAQPGRCRRVDVPRLVGVDGAAPPPGRPAAGEDQVLDRRRHAVERTDGLAALPAHLARRRRRQRLVAGDEAEGVDRRIDSARCGRAPPASPPPARPRRLRYSSSSSVAVHWVRSVVTPSSWQGRHPVLSVRFGPIGPVPQDRARYSPTGHGPRLRAPVTRQQWRRDRPPRPASSLVGIAVLAGAGPLTPGSGRALFAVAAIPFAATTVWLAVLLPSIVDGEVRTASVEWVPQLGLDLDLRLDGFAALMLVLVAGIGVLVFAYAARYFARPTPHTAACSGCSCSSAARWRASSSPTTSSCCTGSGSSPRSRRSCSSATTTRIPRPGPPPCRPLLVTGAGALAMLAGFIVLGQTAGTYQLSASSPTRPAVTRRRRSPSC